MSAQGTYPIGARTLSGADTVTGVVTGTTADIPLSMLANYASLNSTFVYAVETQTASLGQTVFTLSSPYSNGVPGALAVYADGLRLVKDADYTETNSTTVTFTSAVAYTYEVVFVIGGEVGIAPVSIVSVVWTGGTHAPGTLDTYTITFTDSSTTTFQVYNGADWPVGGPGAFSTLSASGTVSGDGFTALFASPPPIGSTAASTGSFTTLATSGNATLGDAEATDTHAVKGATTVLANSASAALKITQTGAGNAFVVEDSASTDATPVVIDGNGRVILGSTQAYNATGGYPVGFSQYAINGESTFGRFSNDASTVAIDITKSRGASVGTQVVVQSADEFGRLNFAGSDGTNYIVGARISAAVDGTPGTNDMPGRLVFSTTAAGASSPTIAMSVNSKQNVGIGGVSAAGISLLVAKNATGSTFSDGIYVNHAVQSDVTARSSSFVSSPSVANSAFTLTNWNHFSAYQGTKGAGATVTNQSGFLVDASLTGATNNYGFFGGIAAGANRFNFYAAGTADNYFAGNVGIGAVPYAGTNVNINKALTGSTSGYGVAIGPTVNSDVTNAAYGVGTYIGTQAASFTLSALYHFSAGQNVIGAGSTVTNQIGFNAPAGLTGATNNYGFFGNIAAGAGRWNFYASGTAANYFAGDVQLGKTVTAGGTTGAQTINKTVGTVNFAAAATSLVVTNSLVTTSSIITATVGTNDSTMKSVAVVAAAGSFTLHANAAATAETRVNFHVFN